MMFEQVVLIMTGPYPSIGLKELTSQKAECPMEQQMCDSQHSCIELPGTPNIMIACS